MNNLDRGVNIAILIFVMVCVVRVVVTEGIGAGLLWLLYFALSLVLIIAAGASIAWLLGRRDRR